jgi:mycothiol system anti-sigma-R factor
VITCAEAVQQLWAYLDGVVDEPSRAAIDEHLSFCRRCCGEAEFAVELRSFMAALAAEQLPDDVRARLAATLDRLEEGAA